MQTIFLLAGANKRFYPFNENHKAMTPLYGKPILYHVINSLKKSGLNDFIFVLREGDNQTKEYFQDGKSLEVSISYVFLDAPRGQGAALLKASSLITGPFMVINPYHIDQEGLTEKILQLFKAKQADAVIPGIYEEQIEEYGSLEIEKDRIKNIVEKPPKGTEPSHFKATFGYIFRQDFLELLKEQPENHYSYELAIADYCHNRKVFMFEIPQTHQIATLKYPWHLLSMKELIGKQINGYISPTAQIASTAIIEKNVYIDDGAIIHDYVCIKGSTYVGKNATIGNFSLIRDSDIGEEVKIGVHSDITRSIIMKGTHTHGSGFIGDSIIGEHCHLAYGFVTANKRLDRGPIHGYLNGAKIHISERFGAIIGNEVHAGVNVSTMPGVIVKSQTHISAGETINRNLE